MALVLDGTNGVSGVDGTASNPSLEGTDSNTGVFFPAADTVAIGTGGTEALRVNSSQNVGIGTNSPTARLTVVTGAAGNNEGEIRISDNATYYAGLRRVNASDEFRIGSYGASQNITFYTVSSERARIDSSGNMMWNGTNTTTQNGNVGYIYKFFGAANNIIIPLESSGSNRYASFEYRRTGRASARTSQIGIGENASNQGDVQVYSSAANADLSGGVSLSNGATAWAAISDIRLKTVTGTYTNALQDIAQIEPIKFVWNHDQSNTPQVGVSAQSVENIVPEAITRSKNIATPDDETEYLSVRYTELIPLMIASIKELNAKVEAQAAEIAALKGTA